MKTVMHSSLRASLGLLLLLGLWALVAGGATSSALSPRAHTAILAALGIATLCAVLFGRMRSEDRVARLEAELCRERGARGQADDALAEADLLLARLSARGSAGRAASDPASQLGLIQLELAQIQYGGAVDVALAVRLELLRSRLDRVARTLRDTAPATEANSIR